MAAADAFDNNKATIRAFTGFIAIFIKGYEGQKLSVRLAGKWHAVDPLDWGNKGYALFKQKTGAGYVANVIVFIDGVKIKRETVTTK